MEIPMGKLSIAQQTFVLFLVIDCTSIAQSSSNTLGKTFGEFCNCL